MTNSRGWNWRVVLGGAGRVPRIGVAKPNVEPEVLVHADLDTLAAALYVRTDDLLKRRPASGFRGAPEGGIAPMIRDAEVVKPAPLSARRSRSPRCSGMPFS